MVARGTSSDDFRNDRLMKQAVSLFFVFLLVFSAHVFIIPVFAADSTFGYTSIGASERSYSGGNILRVCNYTSPSDCGTITKISWYGSPFSGRQNAKGVIYSNLGNAPSALLASSSNVSLPFGYAWQNFTVNYVASPNTIYWIGYMIIGGDWYRYNSASGYRQEYTFDDHFISGWSPPDPFVVGGTNANYEMSIFATYTPAPPDTTAPTYASISVNNASGWNSSKAVLTGARADATGVVYNNKLYVMGGYGTSSSDVSAEVYCYDPSTDTWSTKTSMNHATWGSAAAVYNGVAYDFGGSSSYTQAYSFSDDNWTDKTGTPGNLTTGEGWGIMAVTVGSKIYLFNDKFTYEYDPVADTFTQKQNSTVGKLWGACAYVSVSGEDRIYIIGGYNLATTSVTTSNYYYRPANNDWSSAQAVAPYAAYGVLRDNPIDNGLVYYGFGYDQARGTFYSSLYAYNASANSWSSALPSASYKRDGVVCGIINNKLYVVGGREVETAPYGVNRNEEYSPASVSSLRGFNCKWTDNRGLSGYIFGTNNTGAFVNDSWTAFQANPSWANVTKTLNTAATAVTYQWWATDTSNNWATTGMQTLTIDQNVYTVTVTAFGSGSVNLNNSGPYHYGDVVELTATPASGWSFSAWSGDLSGSANPTTILINSDKTAAATFSQNTYTLTVTILGTGSVGLNNSGPYHYGDVVEITANPVAGWSFDRWDADLGGSTNPTTILINGNKSVTATFTEVLYGLTITTVGSGSVNLNNSGPYHYGDVVELTVVPVAGWSFQGWSGDLLDSANPATLLINGNKAVTATFAQNTLTPFSIVSNSTVTQLAFNSTSKVLEFTVSGPSDTYGFTNVTIAKTLISDISTLNITFDGNQMSYTINNSTEFWSIFCTYHHSTHSVVMEFAPQQTKTSTTLSNAATIAVIGLAIVISTALAITTKRKRRLSNFTKRKH